MGWPSMEPSSSRTRRGRHRRPRSRRILVLAQTPATFLNGWSTTSYTASVAANRGVIAAATSIAAGDPCANPDHPFGYCVERRYMYVLLVGAVALAALILAAVLDARERRHLPNGRRVLARLLVPALLTVVGGRLVFVYPAADPRPIEIRDPSRTRVQNDERKMFTAARSEHARRHRAQRREPAICAFGGCPLCAGMGHTETGCPFDTAFNRRRRRR